MFAVRPLISVAALLVFPVFFTTLELTADNTPAYNPDDSAVVQSWIDYLLVLTEESWGFTPPVAARAFGYTGVSLYESVRLSTTGARSLAGQLNGFDETLLKDIDTSKEYDWNIVANANLAESARTYYPNALPTYKSRIDELEQELRARYSKGVDMQVVVDSVILGKSVARAIARYAATDGRSTAYAENFPKDYKMTAGEGMWVPTPRAYKSALLPGWGDTRPFITQDVETIPPPPPQYSLESESPFFREVKEVYNTAKNLTPENKAIAQFWSDEPMKTATPSGHSLSILRQVLNKENASLATAAVTFAKVGISVHDSFIACWRAKYMYNTVRPVTVIRDHVDPEFEMVLDTPPFPEYPSCHSVQSAAVAEVLTKLFGEHYSFTDESHKGRTDMESDVRRFGSFEEFAQEAAISRLYGGIHFRSAIEEGLKQGNLIGQNVVLLHI